MFERNKKKGEKRAIIENEKRGNLLENIVNSAANSAADVMSKKRPRFSKKFIMNYLDKDALGEYAQKIAPYIQEGKISPEDAYKKLASYIVSGDLLTEEGREMILEGSLEKEANKLGGLSIKSRRAKRALKGEKYLDEAMEAFREVYDLIKLDEDYARHNPELSKAVLMLYDLGFKDATLTALRKNLPKDEYVNAKLRITQAAEQAGNYTKKTLSDYYQNIAAAIMALAGIGVLIATYSTAGNIITGNAIGTSNSTAGAAVIFGIASLILGAYLFIRKR